MVLKEYAKFGCDCGFGISGQAAQQPTRRDPLVACFDTQTARRCNSMAGRAPAPPGNLMEQLLGIVTRLTLYLDVAELASFVERPQPDTPIPKAKVHGIQTWIPLPVHLDKAAS